jgi:hypothetical protein
MRQGSPARYGAAAGAAGVLLFVAGALVIGDLPGFDADGAEIAAGLSAARRHLFATDGAFAADGILGLYVPVAAVAGWVLIASLTLALSRVDRPREAR